MPEGDQNFPGEYLQWCELELTLRGGAQVGENKWYFAFPRFIRPNDRTDSRLVSIPPVVIDHKRLGEHKGDPHAYGKALWEMVCGSREMQQMLVKANTNARALHLPLRVRLFIGQDAPDLHSLWWETLTDPGTDSPLLTREDLFFSRYLASSVDVAVEPQPAHRLRVLYVVANPADIDEYTVNGRSLDRPDLAGQPAPSAITEQLEVVTLGDRTPVTLDNIVKRLREGFDILYLVCHGALVDDQSRLYLETPDRRTAVVPGEKLVARLRDMSTQPRLVVLASCQSAGTGAATSVGDDGELAALGPSLIDAGVAAVVAMQGNVTENTVRRFMPELFEDLSLHGQIDRAMAVARDAVRERSDWWMPVLFMRVITGALWYTPGLTASASDPECEWQNLVDDLEANTSVMVLGSGLGEQIFGSRRAFAQKWAKTYEFPLAPHMRDGLPQVTQYLACTSDRNSTIMQLRAQLIGWLRGGHADLLTDYVGTGGTRDELDALVREIGRRLRERTGRERQANDRACEQAKAAGTPVVLPHPKWEELAYTQIARLPVTTYITTNRDNLLFDSLVAEGRQPEVVVCRWKPMLPDAASGNEERWPPSVFDRESEYKPSRDRPLIYHVFGNMSYPNTVVLTEDDYFDFLVGLSRNQANPKTSMPPHVKMALATYGLVFLGFQLDDWEFRTLFRGVLPREGVEAGGSHSNLAVQVKPKDELLSSPEEACNYMKKYFSQHRKIQVYWGTSEGFLTELTKRWTWSKQ